MTLVLKRFVIGNCGEKSGNFAFAKMQPIIISAHMVPNEKPVVQSSCKKSIFRWFYPLASRPICEANDEGCDRSTVFLMESISVMTHKY